MKRGPPSKHFTEAALVSQQIETTTCGPEVNFRNTKAHVTNIKVTHSTRGKIAPFERFENTLFGHRTRCRKEFDRNQSISGALFCQTCAWQIEREGEREMLHKLDEPGPLCINKKEGLGT